MDDGFVKEPAVVTRKNFDPKGMSSSAIEEMKLMDGVRMHEQTKVLLETSAREADVKIVKPFVLVIARDTTHAKQLLDLIQSAEFFEGRYKDKVIQVDSSKTGAEEEKMIADLLTVEHNEDPTEIVIHVNMLKEGWDVTNLYTEEDVWQLLHHHQKDIAKFIHGQMHEHYREETSGYEVKISKGFTELKPSAFTIKYGQKALDFHVSPADKSNMAKYLFGGFSRCLYAAQKFDSEAERVLSVILDREADKWFKPAKGQFQIYYKNGADHPEYQPDFVVETEASIFMLEPKSKKDLEDPVVVAKKEAAERWCERASDHNAKHGGKPWEYALISHDKIAQNMTVAGLVALKAQ